MNGHDALLNYLMTGKRPVVSTPTTYETEHENDD